MFSRPRAVLGRRVPLAVALATIAMLTLSSGILAQGQTALTISPARMEFNADPGSSIEATVTLTNLSTRPMTLGAEHTDFVAGDDGKTPQFVAPDDSSPWSMSAWMSSQPATFTLAPGEKQVVRIAIDVPEDAEPGGHYSAVLFAGADDAADGTGVVAKVGSLILVTVSGDIEESGSARLTVPWLSDSGPIGMEVAFTNHGNVHVKPSGVVRVIDSGGETVAEIPCGGENVLPRSARKFVISWENPPKWGFFTVEAELDYGDGKRATAEPARILVGPWQLVLFGLGVFVAGLLAGRVRRRKAS